MEGVTTSSSAEVQLEAELLCVPAELSCITGVKKLIRIIQSSGLKGCWTKSAYCEDVRLISLFTSLKWDPHTKAFVSCEPVMDGSDIDALTVRGAEKMHGLNYP